jgi:hypothetical protein
VVVHHDVESGLNSNDILVPYLENMRSERRQTDTIADTVTMVLR